jgi:hypothetical protein
VDVTLDDYGGNFYGAELSWYINDNPLPNTANQRSITITAGESGSRDILKLSLKREGLTEVVTSIIEPIYLDIIVEPQTHVPNFFEGRALPSIGSIINLTALLSNKTLQGNNFIYTWRLNQQVLEGGPLRGRNKISFPTPQDSNIFISLQVANTAGVVVAKRSVIIPSVKPQIHFYEISTLYGIEKRSLKENFGLIGNSATLKAEPYYLDSQTYNAPNILEWSINRNIVSSSNSNPYEMTLQKTGSSGTASLGFHVRSTTQLLQGNEGSIDISI